MKKLQKILSFGKWTSPYSFFPQQMVYSYKSYHPMKKIQYQSLDMYKLKTKAAKIGYDFYIKQKVNSCANTDHSFCLPLYSQQENLWISYSEFFWNLWIKTRDANTFNFPTKIKLPTESFTWSIITKHLISDIWYIPDHLKSKLIESVNPLMPVVHKKVIHI